MANEVDSGSDAANAATMDELSAAFDRAWKTAQDRRDWYDRHRRRYSAASFYIRMAAVLALFSGVLLPILYPGQDVWFLWLIGASSANAALASLSIGALLVALNQIFLVSSTWARFVAAMMAIEYAMINARWDWELLKLQIGKGTPTDEQRKTALTLMKTLDVDALKTVQAETATWSSELSRAMEQLATMMKDQRTAAEAHVAEMNKAVEAARKAAEPLAPGAVKVLLAGKVDRFVGVIKVAVAGQERTAPGNSPVFAFPNIPAGFVEIKIDGRDAAGNPIAQTELVEVASGKLKDVKVDILPG